MQLKPDDSESPQRLTRHQAEEFYQKYADSNRQLGEVLFGNESLFSLGFSEYPEISSSSTSIDNNTVSEALSGIANFIRVMPDIGGLNMDQNEGSILRDLALRFEAQKPELALFLFQQAQIHLPDGPYIKTKD